MQYHRCDVCKKNDAILNNVFIKDGNGYDHLEGHYDKGENVDLCAECTSKLFKVLLEFLNNIFDHDGYLHKEASDKLLKIVRGY